MRVHVIIVLLATSSVATALGSVTRVAPRTRARFRVSNLERSVSALASTAGIVAVDAENVRGKSGFRLGHAALLAATAEWTSAHDLHGRVVVVIDHGAVHQGFYVPQHGIGIGASAGLDRWEAIAISVPPCSLPWLLPALVAPCLGCSPRSRSCRYRAPQSLPGRTKRRMTCSRATSAIGPRCSVATRWS